MPKISDFNSIFCLLFSFVIVILLMTVLTNTYWTSHKEFLIKARLGFIGDGNFEK